MTVNALENRKVTNPLFREAQRRACSWWEGCKRALGAEPSAVRSASPITAPVDSRAFRNAMGHLPTGVTVITTEWDNGVHGMTANAVTSVSLDPPLVLVCVSRSARMFQYLNLGHSFAVNILAEDQESLSRHFSGTLQTSKSLPHYQLEDAGGVHVLAGSVASLVCEVTERYGGGDHDVVLGRVRSIHRGAAKLQPLVFFRGGYAGIALSSSESSSSTVTNRRQTVRSADSAIESGHMRNTDLRSMTSAGLAGAK